MMHLDFIIKFHFSPLINLIAFLDLISLILALRTLRRPYQLFVDNCKERIES